MTNDWTIWLVVDAVALVVATLVVIALVIRDQS